MPIARSAAGIVGFLAAVASFFGALGGAWWGFDLLANFRMQYLAILVAAAIVMIVTRASRALLGVVIAAVAFNAILIAPLYLRDPAAAEPGSQLTVISFNTQLSHPRRQMDWILANEPDVVFLFESSRPAQEWLRENVSGYVVTSGIQVDRLYGVTVLTRSDVPLEFLAFAESGGEAVRLEMLLGDAGVAVYGIHPPSPSKPWRTPARDSFLAEAGEVIASDALPVVVAGDFNTTPWAQGFDQLTTPGNLANSQEGFGFSPTWPTTLPAPLRIPLDHLVHSRALTVVDREVGPPLDSDHLPLRVVIARGATGRAHPE